MNTRAVVWQSFILILLLLLLPGCPAGSKKTPQSPEADAGEAFQEKEIIVSDVTLGPGDEIEISVWRNPDLDGSYKLDSSGMIFIPLLGVLPVQDVSALDLREKIVEGFSKYFVNPQVKVTITAFLGRKVYILGEVQRPGIFYLDSDLRLVDALAKSGGFTKDARPKHVLLIRGGLENGQVEDYNMMDLLRKGDVSQNPRLGKGDIVYVPSSFISNVDRFFEHLQTIITPLYTIERGTVLMPLAEDAFKGNEEKSRIIILESR